MRLAFGRIKVYSKLTLIVLVMIAIGVVLWKNRDHQVNIWFFGLVHKETSINVIWVMLYTALGALVSYWVLSLVRGLWKDVRKAANESALREKEKRQQERAKELQEQEKRIDAKLKKAISDK
ncbi:MAG: hypothetical protein KAV82_12925 [Phycisphaerae bacterium]|nr:hypothetical protein [Phycisphaerae bacterium]